MADVSLLQSVNPSVPGMMVKRSAVDKGGMPVYQPAGPAAYPPLVQFAQQPYMPAVTREFPRQPTLPFTYNSLPYMYMYFLGWNS